MEPSTILWIAAGFLLALFATNFLKRTDTETSTLRAEVQEMAIAFGKFETKLESLMAKMTAPAPTAQASPLSGVLEVLVVVEKLKSIGLIQIGAR